MKLGLSGDARALVIGELADPALIEATAGALAPDGAAAQMIIAVVADADGLAAAMRAHDAHPALPLWMVYPKGRATAIGDGAIRTALRAHGLRDSKSCAVSDTLTATRYARPASPGTGSA